MPESPLNHNNVKPENPFPRAVIRNRLHFIELRINNLNLNYIGLHCLHLLNSYQQQKEVLVIKMSQERVQFFNSQSSFGSQSSLASSRYFDLANLIVQQTDSIFLTLRKEFLPTKDLTNFDKIQYLNNRAKIIYNDTIPDHLAPKQSKQQCIKCSDQLKKLIKDLQSLQNGTMLHKQFYNIYGRSNEDNVFFKKDHPDLANPNVNNHMMEPDVVQIYQPRTSRVKNTVNQYNVSARGIASNISNISNIKDKQVKDLHEQIARMKKRQSQLKRQHEDRLANQKINCEKRIRMFLNTLANIDKKAPNDLDDEKINNYKNQMTILQNQLEAARTEKEEVSKKNKELEQKIYALQSFTESLKQELVKYRRLQNSRFQEGEEQMSRSFHSQNNQNSGKQDSSIKKLIAQRDILRSQLTKQRQKLHQQKIRVDEDQAKEVVRLKKSLQQKKEQNEELQRQFDKLRIDVIQLKQENKSLRRDISLVKQNSQKLKNKSQLLNLDNHYESTNLAYRSEKNVNFRKSKVQGTLLQESIVSKVNSFDQYAGQTIEGNPYFQLLSKQFKIRFKRACLKNKELLYKGDGLEIGVISELFAPNSIKVLVHITNNSESDIKNFKVKAMNPNENKVEYQVEEIKLLSPGQQIKIPVSCTIKNYPIGPVVLVMDYTGQTKHDLRLLLPVHIFKCVNVERRQEKLVKPTKFAFKAQRKICKDLNTIKQYLGCEDLAEIKVKVRHEHSSSYLFMDLFLNKDDIQIQYEHVEGFSNFSDYYIKMLKVLLQKQS